ncbi:hypothetical protein D3C72_1867920 [compost metagenome]
MDCIITENVDSAIHPPTHLISEITTDHWGHRIDIEWVIVDRDLHPVEVIDGGPQDVVAIGGLC